MKRIPAIFLLILFAATTAVSAQPQTAVISPNTNMSRAAQYYIGDSSELLMRVNIWGRVQKPGQYFVPSTTDLITLISAAGGPADKSRLDNIKIVRSSEGGSQIIEVDVKQYLKTGDLREIPTLKPEDTVIVSGSMWYLVSQAVSLVAQFAIVANVYYWLVIKGT